MNHFATKIFGVVLCASLGLGVSASVHAKITFIPLPNIPGAGVTNSFANSVAADGHAIFGSSYDAGVNFEATYWLVSNGFATASGLGDLPGGSDISFASAASANSGVVVGQASSASGNEAFRYDLTGSMIGLGVPLGGGFSSVASGVSDDGNVVVGQATVTGGSVAFRWTQSGGMVSLGDFAGGALQSFASDASADGSVVVGAGDASGFFQPFRWTSGSGLVNIGDLPGGGLGGDAQAVSADGNVIVGYSSSASGSEAYRWTSGGGIVGLGDLPGGVFGSLSKDVSASGNVVVGVGSTATGDTAFVWDQTNGMRSIPSLITSAGVSLTGWNLTVANAVSADGRTVVGYGTNPSGDTQAWLAYISNEVSWSTVSSGIDEWDYAFNWTGPERPTSVDDVTVAPNRAVDIAGPSSTTTVNSFVLGGGSVHRTRLLLNSGSLSVNASATIESNGELVVSENKNLSANTVRNYGVIRGSGTVAGDMANYNGGEVRVAAGESLTVSGSAHTNEGKIEVIGGELEVLGSVTNEVSTGIVTARDAMLRFQQGLSNEGGFSLTGGTNDVSGDINNRSGATLTVTGGANAVFYDDISQNGTLLVRRVGLTNSTAVFLGAFTGSGGSTGGGDMFFEGDLRPGNSPASVTFDNNIGFGDGATTLIELGGTTLGSQYDHVNVMGDLVLDGDLNLALIGGFTPSIGDSFNILDWGSLSGTFDAINLPALSGMNWITSQLYTTGTLLVALPGDFDADGDVDGRDFLIWQRGGSPDPLSAGDLNDWKANYGLGALSAASTAVPEPGGLLLALLGIYPLSRKRQRFFDKRLNI